MGVAEAIIGGLAAVLLMGAIIGYASLRLSLRRRLPQTSGRLTVEGISAPVTIARDLDGVPHVDATSMADAAFAMGVLHAQDRLWQMELTRRVIAGRLSEFAGPDALTADRFLRRVGLMRVAETEATTLGGDGARVLDAYAAGVNSVASRPHHPLPIEFTLTRLGFEPWRPADSLAAAKLLNLGLALNWDIEAQRLRLLLAIGPERAARLDLVYQECNPTILAVTAAATENTAGVDGLVDAYREVARWLPNAGGGSNSWVVDGSQTTSGRPLLCNDPHLPPGVPSIWYTAHVCAGGDFESIGVTVAGLPFPILGHNRDIAWGYTNSFADVQDLVIEEFDDAAGRRHRTAHGFADTEVRREIIRVRGRDDEVEEVLTTGHGPVVERIDDAQRGVFRGLALQWTAYQPGDTMGAMLAIQRARTFAEFSAAHHLLDGPSQNAIYADREGHIGYVMSGRVPVRRTPPTGLPVPGWTGDADWVGCLALDEMPHAYDPPEHRIVTANNRVVGPGYPHHISHDYMNGYRALRITELLEGGGLDRARMRAIQLDTVCPPARQVIALLGGLEPIAGATAEKLRKRLLGWDASMRAETEEPLLYEAFVRRLCEQALRPLCGDAWTILGGPGVDHPIFDYPGNIIGRLLPDLLHRWKIGDTRLFEGSQATWPGVATAALAGAAAEIAAIPRHRRRWGEAHRLRLSHPLARAVPALGTILNLGSFPLGGNSDTVLATGYDPNHPYRTVLWTPSWRTVMDPGDWSAATGIHLGGASGQPGSRHHHDLLADWRANRQRPLRWDREAVEIATRATLVLSPRATPVVESTEVEATQAT